MARLSVRSCTSPMFRSWIRSRSVSCSSPPTVWRSDSSCRLTPPPASSRVSQAVAIRSGGPHDVWPCLRADRVFVRLHRHGDRSGGVARRPLVPGEDLLLPRPGVAFRCPVRKLCRLGRGRTDFRCNVFPTGPAASALFRHRQSITPRLLLGVGLYYGVLTFNLGVTFWIGEFFMGMSGLLMHLPALIILIIRLTRVRRSPAQ